MLVGGGHTHVQVLRAIGMQPWPGVRVTVISRELRSPYSGMLPGHVAGVYTDDEMHIDLAPLVRFAGARLIHASVIGVDVDNHEVLCAGRPPIRYDVLSINSGSAPEAVGRGVAVKPIGRFLPKWRETVAGLQPGARIAIIGTGAGGVELALAMRAARADLDVHLVGRSWLPGFNARAARLLHRACEARGVTVQLGDEVTDAALPDADALFWVTAVVAPPWVAQSGLAVDANGFVRVNAYLRCVSHDNIFAAGDVACLEGQERPKAGVYAVRAGPVLVRNLRAALLGGRLQRFRPQRQFLTLMGVGDGTAVAAKWGLAWRSRLMWRWKDHIDRTFMQRFCDLPRMEPAPPALPPALQAAVPDTMRCGGCGAKLGADLLSRVLGRLPITPREDVEVGIGDDAAVVRSDGRMVVSTDGLRGMMDDTYRFGRIVAHHNLNDLFAMGARPATALAMATVPLMAEPLMEAELTELLLGAVHVLEEHDVTLVGGHSSEGAELFLALTVMGAPGGRAFHKSGLQVNDVLVLTKPIGTGVLLAADMRGEAAGEDVAAAVQSMDLSNATACALLAEHEATAVTDVTGFGLLGHLAEMLRASDVGAEVQAARVPLLAGARQLIDAGIASSLQENNERVLGDFHCQTDARLLCDPQTSGGLLAGVPQAQAQALIAALHAAGYPQATVIGAVTERPGAGRVGRVV